MTIKTAHNKIGTDEPVYFIADIGANHDGDLSRAKDLIHLVAETGGHAAKFQNFQAKHIVSKRGFASMGKTTHQEKWGKPVYDVYEDASISQAWTAELSKECERAGIDYFTSPYDFASVDHVDPFVDLYKIGSGDITWLEIIDYIASKGKPVLLATGASTMEDVDRAMAAILKKTTKIVLMQCNTNYTGSLENFKHCNLNVLKTFKNRFPTAVLGLSDHTPGHTTTLGAIALGAKVIEKHFTDSNDRPGPDHGFAMNPKTWKEMVERSKELELALGDGIKRVEENEKESIKVQRRSLHLTRSIRKGDILKREDFVALRPIVDDAVPPHQIDALVNKTALRDLSIDESIKFSDFS